MLKHLILLGLICLLGCDNSTTNNILTDTKGSDIDTAVIIDTFYNITVESGSGSGPYAVANEVTIAADSINMKRFHKWTGSGVEYLTSDTANPTTFSMPRKSLTFTATYVEDSSVIIDSTEIDTLEITTDAIKEIGKHFHSVLMDTLKVYPTSDSYSIYTDAIGSSVSRAVEDTLLSSQDYSFYVFEDETAIAYSVPGGYTYISSGLINAIPTAGQVSALLAHEIAHNALGHYTDMVIKSCGVNYLTKLIAGETTARELTVNVALYLAQMKMSRNDEYEADSLASYYLNEIETHSPWSMVLLLETLSTLNEEYAMEYLSIHPDFDKRADSLETVISTQYPGSLTTTDTLPNPFNKK